MKNISTNILSLGAGIYTAGLFLFNNTDNMVLAGHFLFALVIVALLINFTDNEQKRTIK